jgi:hypothetical protein
MISPKDFSYKTETLLKLCTVILFTWIEVSVTGSGQCFPGFKPEIAICPDPDTENWLRLEDV